MVLPAATWPSTFEGTLPVTAAIPRRLVTRSGASYVSVGSGEPLVLIHGVGLRLESWRFQIETFSSTCQVLAVDMPGHGDSEPLSDGAQLADYVDWLHDVLAELAVAPVNLCGHSMGALISLGFALTYPRWTRRTALICGVYKRDDSARSAVVARAQAIDRGDLGIDSAISRWFETQRSPAEAKAAATTRDWLSSVDRQGYAAAYRAFASGDMAYADRLGELACPALFLTGSADRNSTPTMAEAMAAEAPRGRAVVVRGERHMVQMVAPEPVNAALQTWLTTSELAGEKARETITGPRTA